MKNREIVRTMILLTLGLLGLSPIVQAVEPAAPDTALAGGNTADGQSALAGLTSGMYNSAFGVFSLLSNGAANFNTGVGAGTLLSNTANENTATGAGALFSNAGGARNAANGAFALFSTITGNDNTAVGDRALFLANNADGNTAVGSGALKVNIGGSLNTVIGAAALVTNTSGNSNTAVGLNALFSNNANNNTAVGRGALGGDTSGHDNTALGIGAGSGVTTASNVISIGTAGDNVDNSCYIGQIFGTTIANGPVPVLINSNNRLGTMTSSRRFKDEIKPMGKASEVIFALKPVSFRYKKEIDPVGVAQFGLVAEEVEKANPELVVRDKEGKPYTVRYDQVNAMLLNEFLKEHKKVEAQQGTIDSEQASIAELKSTVAQQQKGMEVLTAQLKEQAAQIQKVSVQVEASKPATKVVLNNP